MSLDRHQHYSYVYFPSQAESLIPFSLLSSLIGSVFRVAVWFISFFTICTRHQKGVRRRAASGRCVGTVSFFPLAEGIMATPRTGAGGCPVGAGLHFSGGPPLKAGSRRSGCHSRPPPFSPSVHDRPVDPFSFPLSIPVDQDGGAFFPFRRLTLVSILFGVYTDPFFPFASISSFFCACCREGNWLFCSFCFSM